MIFAILALTTDILLFVFATAPPGDYVGKNQEVALAYGFPNFVFAIL